MKQEKCGFTLIELIGVITILALLLVILIPTIRNLGDNSKVSLRDSKISTLETAAEQYGNEKINDLIACQGSSDAKELEEKCTTDARELITNGYLEADDKDNNLIDPKTNKAFGGKVLMCYNPQKVSVYASYVEDGNYSCDDISVQSDNTLNLSSSGGVGYVGGNDLEISIIKGGVFEGATTCSIDNENSDADTATCRVEGNKLFITPTKNSFTDKDFKQATVILVARYTGGQLTKKYNLKVLPTSMSIPDVGDACMEINTTRELDLAGDNIGSVSVTSDNPNIIEGISKDNKLSIATKGETGLGKLTLVENNGKNELVVEKKVYKLNMDKLPDSMLFGKVDEMNIDFSGTGEITVTSSNPSSIQLSKANSTTGSSSITLSEGDTKFYIIGFAMGSSTISVKGSICGDIENVIKVSNLGLNETSGTLYVGGAEKQVGIDVDDAKNLHCSSSDEVVAACNIVGKNLVVKPGGTSGEVTIKVINEIGAFVTYYASVLDTSIEVVDESSQKVSNVCTEKGSGVNDKQLYARGLNIGALTVTPNDANLAQASITSEGLSRKISINNTSVPSPIDPYKAGYNTGRTSVKVQETNGNKAYNFYYNIYTMSLSKTSGKVVIDDSINFDVTVSGTGEVTAESADSNIAIAEVIRSTSYDNTVVNKEYTRTIKVTGLKEGHTTITVKGSYCGTKTFDVEVTGRLLTINIAPGSYTKEVAETRLTCTTKGADRTCQVTLPNMTPLNENFEVQGYHTDKDSLSTQFEVGDKFTIDRENDGTTIYANSADIEQPSCKMLVANEVLKMKMGSTVEAKFVCTDMGSGIKEKTITPDDFYTSRKGSAQVTSVTNPVAIENGYSYDIEIESKDIGYSNLLLKPNVIQDVYGNNNDSATTANIASGEYDVVLYEGIGKAKIDDVFAMLYDNSEVTGDSSKAGTYFMKIYGTGDMKDFMTEEFNYLPGWYETYHELITDLVIESGVTSIGDYIMWSSTKLENVTIPDGVTTIGTSSFEYCSIKGIRIPASVKEIKSGAFFYDNTLSSLIFEGDIEIIGDHAFHINSIESLTIPASVRYIGTSAFENDLPKLKELIFEDNSSLTEISEKAFYYNNLSVINIPSGIEKIGKYAFDSVEVAETPVTIEFPVDSQLQTIEDGAFSNVLLDEINIPDTVTAIGSYAFYQLDASITSFYIGQNIQSLGGTFAAGPGLTKFVVAPENPYFIVEDGILYSKDKTVLIKVPDCFHRTHDEFTIPDTVTTLANGAFEGFYFHKEKSFILNIPDTVTEINVENNFSPFNISKINIANNTKYLSEDGVIYSKDKKTLYRIPTAYKKDKYVIPEGVETISDYVAYVNFGVKSISIPDSTKYIGMSAFISDVNYAFSRVDLLLESYDDAVVKVNANAFNLKDYDLDGREGEKRMIYSKYTEVGNKMYALALSLNSDLQIIIDPNLGMEEEESTT